MKFVGAQAVQYAKKKEQISYLEYSLLMIKIHYIFAYFQHFSFFLRAKLIKE